MMIRQLLICFTCYLSIALVGCSSSPRQVAPDTRSANKSTSQQSSVYKRLNSQYSRWKGTPYELGGLNKRGIDCSGFVHVAFRDAFGMKLPRTTEDLAAAGENISRHQLNIGDLVFFKTGFSKRHVGIYVGNQQFIHASTSKGVMKSNLTNPYWSEHYWKSTRLLSN
ncbi:NlpC/P60 family protein [Kaarinaea lacus]